MMAKRAEAFGAASEDHEHDDVAVVSTADDGAHRSPHPEVMRAIRYLLYRHELNSGSTHLPQMIAVVSASAGEGVSTVSRSLAEILASERSSSVCWIDFGGSGSRTATRPGRNHPELPGIPGMLHDVDREAPAGTQPQHPIRLLAPDKNIGTDLTVLSGRPEFEDLLNGLARDYRYVVFDTPPLLSRSDSLGFLRRADAYLLVARQGAATVNQLSKVAEELRPIPSLGAVLNDHRSRTPRFVRRFFAE